MECSTSRALACLLLAAAAGAAAAMMPGMPGMGMPSAPSVHAVKSDVQYIRCQVCEAVVKQALRRVKAMREELKPGKRLDEADVIDHLEKMCDPTNPAGAWLAQLDLQESGSELKLVDMGKPSKCNTECMTVARACAQLTDALDLSDLSEALYQGKSRSSLTQWACYEQTSACKNKAPPLPKDRKPGPAFTPMSEEEARHEQLMASMKAAGLGGQMFNKDDIASQIKHLQEQADEGDIPTTEFRELGGSPLSQGVAKAQEAVGQAAEAAAAVVGQAKEAAAAAVDKASSLLKSGLSSLTSSLKKRAAAGDSDGEL